MDSRQEAVRRVCHSHGATRDRLLDIARAVQAEQGSVGQDAIDWIAEELGVPRVTVEGVVTFYSFLSVEPKGRIVIRLCDDVVDRMMGSERVAAVLSTELGVPFGGTTAEGITLERASFIGMSDQAPAALVNDVVVTDLSSDSARDLVAELRQHHEPKRLVRRLGDGNNAHELVHAMVHNNIRRRGPVILADYERGGGLAKAMATTPQEVIRVVKVARLRGRGGAGFPTGIKWELARAAGLSAPQRYVACNADEGEPGTFKDRVILTECPELMLDGMTIAGYAVGSSEGVLYLRAEYAYLVRYLEHLLEERRRDALLGTDILGRGFPFDIRIQVGAGAYICGEESALINSVEGGRGEPRVRPPFPVDHGLFGRPTVVNNVETFCAVARIFERGGPWFSALGTKTSTGTKLFSISGDCASPGVYEMPFGVTVGEILTAVEAEPTAAVLVGGASGNWLAPHELGRTIDYDDLPTGGAIILFGENRNVVESVRELMRFFEHESCGFCTPCRVGNRLARERLDHILAGRGKASDLDYLSELAGVMRVASLCGLGQSASRPLQTTLERFRPAYEALLEKHRPGMQPSFDLRAALRPAEQIAGRRSALHAPEEHDG